MFKLVGEKCRKLAEGQTPGGSYRQTSSYHYPYDDWCIKSKVTTQKHHQKWQQETYCSMSICLSIMRSYLLEIVWLLSVPRDVSNSKSGNMTRQERMISTLGKMQVQKEL